MFALAIWDQTAGELVLARDPYGIKPLFYSLDGGMLRFASLARALDAGGGLSREVDPAAVAGLLSWGAVPEPLSLRKSIRALPAGHWARVSCDGSFVLETVPRVSLGESPVDAASALAESVRAHLVSDVPVGIFLSAGLDSALVAALAVRGAPEKGEPLTALTHLGRGPRHRGRRGAARPRHRRGTWPAPRGARDRRWRGPGAHAADTGRHGPALDRRLPPGVARPAREEV
jgi:asparagine synthase (glutamine-hydrolysing)